MRRSKLKKFLYYNYVFLILIGYSFDLKSQTRFSTIFHPGNNEPNIAVLDSSYVVLQQGNPEIDQLLLMRFSHQGIYEETDTIQLKAFYEDCKGCFVKVDGGYIKAGTYFYSNDSAEVSLIRFDKDLDTVSTDSYSRYNERTTDVMGVHQGGANKILLLGEYLRSSTANYSGLLVCIDTNLNVVWEQQYSLPSLNSQGGLRTTNAISTTDKGYLIGGYFLRRNPFQLRGLIIKTDSLGNEEWRKYLDGIVQNDEVLLQALPSGNALYACTASDTASSVSGNAISRLRIGEIDILGNIIWEKLIGNPSLFMEAYYILATADSNYVIGGYGSSFNFQSFMQKISANGDSIWFRKISHSDTSSNPGHLQEAKETKDQGFILAGFHEDFGPGGTGVNTWLVKTDQYGCIKPGCQNISINELQTQNFDFEVYPNPISDFLIIQVTGSNSWGTRLYNQLGQLVHEAENTSVIQFPHGQFGIFILEVYANGQVSLKKILKLPN